MGTGSHLGLSFSGLDVLMSTPSSEKDSPLWLPVPVKIAPQFLKKEVFIVTPFILGMDMEKSDRVRQVRLSLTRDNRISVRFYVT